jgi:predicted ATPase/DNA-binding NarL/FixJ family response regulator
MRDDRSRTVQPGKPSPGGARTTSTAAAGGAGALARHNLPLRLTSFVGREREIAEVVVSLGTHRLVTLVGAPGVGKTRLSLEVARSALGGFPDGVWLVEFAPVSDATHVPTIVATALGVREQPGQPLTTTLAEHLGSRHLLLLLDNCEHLIGAVASLTELLLRTCPGLHILATSREPLAIEGEETWRVPSLTLPTAEQVQRTQHEGLAALDEFEAVRLFVVRAQAVARSFELTDRNISAVVQICTRLDGIPLALELAAVRVRALSVQEIAARLDDRFRLLTGGSRLALPRQQTLRGTINWSYDLLTKREHVLLQRLTVFAGGWTLEAAERVCAGEELAADDILDTLASLVDRSLVQAEQDDARGMRYQLLESVRQYALDRLREVGEEVELRRRHLAWAADLPNPDPTMVHAPNGPAWMDRLGAEIDNLRAALAWSVSDPDATSARTGLRLASALYGFWYTRFQLTEGYHWLERTLAADERHAQAMNWIPDSVGVWPGGVGSHGAHLRVAALNLFANLAEDIWDQEQAFRRSEETVALARSVGDRLGEGHAIMNLANYARRYGQYERPVRLFEEALVIFRETDDLHSLCAILGNFGKTCVWMGDNERAELLIRESLAIARSLGTSWGEAEVLCRLGELTFRQGDLNRAIAHLEESLALSEQFGALRGRFWSLLTLGQVRLVQGDAGRAARCFAECLVACHDAGNWIHLTRSLEGLAAAATLSSTHLTDARARHASQLLAAAARQRERSAGTIVPVERPAHDRALATIRASLSEDAFTEAWDEGLAMPLGQIVEIGVVLARQIEAELATSEAESTLAVPAHLEPLTPREREVAILVGRGHTNRQIAEQMVVSERTVEVYARNIRERLGLTTRAQMVAWMIQHGLPDLVD